MKKDVKGKKAARQVDPGKNPQRTVVEKSTVVEKGGEKEGQFSQDEAIKAFIRNIDISKL